ncbi:MAG TPA: hypothetical protein VGD10_01405 [Allosphingosinicella sp.]|uniref:hypothetical protein n=1 Tax=Allosphingosinicella sp. TaxID=2823234 RepID=UPI002ED84ACF
MNAFKIVTASTATGPRLFVAVDYHHRFDILHPDDTNIILTADAADIGEFNGLVDELIEELNHLKASAVLHFKTTG